MEPQPALNLVPTIQQAISTLLTTHEPEFLRFGQSLFAALARPLATGDSRRRGRAALAVAAVAVV